MTFVFDLDDTICDTDGYSEKYIREFFIKNNMTYKQIATDVRFAEDKFDWDKNTALAWYKKFGDQMMAEFPLKQGAKELLSLLHNNGHRIIIATARANDWHTEPEKITLKWLKDNGIEYDKAYIGRIDKEKICEEENADVFIDDDIKITSRVAEVFKNKPNKHVFLSSTNYNKYLEIADGVERIESLNSFTKILNQIYHVPNKK